MNQIIYAGKQVLTYSVSLHAHSSWELIYCTGGSGQLHFDSLSLSYREGDLVIIPPLFFHRNESDAGFTNIHLNYLEPQLNFKVPTVIREDGNRFLLDAFKAAFYVFSVDPGKQSILLASYANLIINLIQANLEAPAYSAVVEEIENCIIRNYPDESFELGRYLHSLPFNYDYLRKLFKQETGITPHQLLSDIRLQAAAEQLGFADARGASISEIAHLCGFREPLYFSRMFKKKYGVSPSQYQSLQQEEKPLSDGESLKIWQ